MPTAPLRHPSVTQALRVLYPLWIAAGIVNLVYVPSVLVDAADPAATAAAIANREGLFRLSVLVGVASQVIYAYVAYLFYVVLRRAGPPRALAMLLLALLSVPLSLACEAFGLHALADLGGAAAVDHALAAQTELRLQASLFWGLWLVPLGQLGVRAGLIPSWVAWGLYATCVGYVGLLTLHILGIDSEVLAGVLGALQLGELLFIGYVLVRGVRTELAAPGRA